MVNYYSLIYSCFTSIAGCAVQRTWMDSRKASFGWSCRSTRGIQFVWNLESYFLLQFPICCIYFVCLFGHKCCVKLCKNIWPIVFFSDADRISYSEVWQFIVILGKRLCACAFCCHHCGISAANCKKDGMFHVKVYLNVELL